ncbi:MAG: zf-TFIIB domain-containing protein [Bacteroidales bacterium]
MPLLVCPNCNVGMTQVHRSGVELDVCPQCRGVWLDRGELEKLLQPLREAESASPGTFLPQGGSPWSQPAPQPAPYRQDSHHGHHANYEHNDHHEKHGHRNEHHYQKQKGWKSILDVFD